MQILRRPAWPVVFLLASGIVSAAGPPEALLDAMARWKRFRAPASAEELAVFERSYAAETARWTARWPSDELAWRERLRALDLVNADPGEAEAALEGAGKARGAAPELRFPQSTLWLMARVAAKTGVRLDALEGWLGEALAEVERELPAGKHPLIEAYRRERRSQARWRAAEIRAEAAYGAKDAAGLRAQWTALAAESAIPVLDPADRVAASERARRRMKVFLWRARLARIEGDPAEAKRRYAQALAARPATPGRPESPANAALIEETGLPPGPGAPLPPVDHSGPHWLAAACPTQEKNGPWLAAVWDGEDPRQARALERLLRRQVRVYSWTELPPETIREVNPLYTAPQIWVADAEGVIRLVGRFQPGGDGWEDAVAGAALRLANR